MLFNSIEFLIFLPIVFVVYWLLGKYWTMQNLLVLIASYVFYGWWDVKFLILIVFTSLWSYFAGLIELSRHPFDFDSPTGKSAHHGSRILLAITLVVNLGILAYFKYCNFFLDSFYGLLSFIGVRPVSRFTLNIILPVGISFYTFQAMSYSIDVYRRTIRPTKDVIAYLAFISFFPQLVAGPIERATNLLPQFLKPRFSIMPMPLLVVGRCSGGFSRSVSLPIGAPCWPMPSLIIVTILAPERWSWEPWHLQFRFTATFPAILTLPSVAGVCLEFA